MLNDLMVLSLILLYQQMEIHGHIQSEKIQEIIMLTIV